MGKLRHYNNESTHVDNCQVQSRMLSPLTLSRQIGKQTFEGRSEKQTGGQYHLSDRPYVCMFVSYELSINALYTSIQCTRIIRPRG